MMKTVFLLGLATVSALQGPMLPSTDCNHGMERRNVLACLTGIVGSGLVPKVASAANEDGATSGGKVIPEATFSTYNVIPDASASLDPRLVEVNPKDFLAKVATTTTSSAPGGGGGSIWLGEHHNSVKDHRFQADFIRLAHSERKKQNIDAPMAIGLEQVQSQFQPFLDEFVDGKIDLVKLREKVEWNKRWMWDFDGYVPVFEAARDLKIRLLALNVDSEDLALVEKDGYQGLPMDRLRKYIKDPVGFGEFANEEQFRTYVNYVISPSYDIHERLGLLQYTIAGEKMDTNMSFRNFLSGRILWDEGMASAAYTWTKQNPGGLVVGLVGADHVKFRNGIPGRFARMARGEASCTSVIINPTLIDTRPSGSVTSVPGSDSAQTPDILTLQLRYLVKGVDPSPDVRARPESTGGVMPLSDYIVVTA